MKNTKNQKIELTAAFLGREKIKKLETQESSKGLDKIAIKINLGPK